MDILSASDKSFYPHFIFFLNPSTILPIPYVLRLNTGTEQNVSERPGIRPEWTGMVPEHTGILLE